MSQNEMPATEVMPAADEQEFASYELAYHVLPTVAEGEVSTVRDRLAAAIEDAGGTVGIEEMPERVELAYEIIKHLEGKNRRFTSAYFGWVRFTATPEAIAAITEAVTNDKAVLRHLLIRLSKAEEALPFYFHEAMANERKVSDVDGGAAVESDIDPNTDAEEADTSDVDDDATAASTETDADDTEVAAVSVEDEASTTDKTA